jgi:hypothetical protein
MSSFFFLFIAFIVVTPPAHADMNRGGYSAIHFDHASVSA